MLSDFNDFDLFSPQQESSAGVSEQHSDLERLKEILFEVTECKDDSQQRGWAVHDDEKAISDLLEELLQILVRTGCGLIRRSELALIRTWCLYVCDCVCMCSATLIRK